MPIIVMSWMAAPVVATAVRLVHLLNFHIGISPALVTRVVQVAGWRASPVVVAIVVTSVAAILGAFKKRRMATSHTTAPSHTEPPA